jgi:hypothetical protein
MWEANKLQVETEEVTVRDFTFDFNTGCFTHALQYWLNKLVTLRRFRFSAANTHRPANIEILVSRLQLSRGADRLFGAKSVTFVAQRRGNRNKQWEIRRKVVGGGSETV